jgi:hypothetical protein
MTSIRIETTGHHGRKILLDEMDITKAVRRVSFDADFRTVEVTLHVAVDQVEIDTLGERDMSVMVNIPDDVVDVLQLLGWVKTSNTTYSIPRPPYDPDVAVTYPEGS